MALQSSGQIKLSEIATEFGGSAPHALSEYYDAASGVPSSGEIQLAADFYGKSNIFSFNVTGSDVNLRSAAVSAGWDESAPVQATVQSGTTITASSSSNDALTVDGSWAGGVTLINSGTVLGEGGNGGNGGSYSGGAGSGAAGGDALNTNVALTVQNNGSLIGGGGGGGGSGGYRSWNGNNIGGGGGGGGAPDGSGGSHGGGWVSNAGSSASSNAGGSGGGSGSPWNMLGGTGGNRGQAGGAGNTSSICDTGCGGGGGGGAAGYAVRGNSNITWTANGTKTGSIG